VGVRAALATLAVALATPTGFVQSHQAADGGFAEPGRGATPGLTAWAVLGLRASGAGTGAARQYLLGHERELETATDVELGVLAESVGGGASPTLLARLRALVRPSGQIGDALNSTYWGVLALRQAGVGPPSATRTFILGRQARSGGWPWISGSGPDSNDTAAAIQALRALGVRGRPIQRGLAYLRARQRADGGFELTPGRGSDAQSTAWAIQAFVAAGGKPPPAAFRYLARLRRPDGSYRYDGRYATTPVWVTSQVLAATARKAFPLR
jgi:energy-coupling factor transport system substrate-specific component